MTLRTKTRKWVLNLWTVALTVLSATGLNPFESTNSPMIRPIETPAVGEFEVRFDVAPRQDEPCTCADPESPSECRRATGR